jgi:hypothetical protein
MGTPHKYRMVKLPPIESSIPDDSDTPEKRKRDGWELCGRDDDGCYRKQIGAAE